MHRYADWPPNILENILLWHLLLKPSQWTGVKIRGKMAVFSLPACCWHRSMPSACQSWLSLRKASPKDSAYLPLLGHLLGCLWLKSPKHGLTEPKKTSMAFCQKKYMHVGTDLKKKSPLYSNGGTLRDHIWSSNSSEAWRLHLPCPVS